MIRGGSCWRVKAKESLFFFSYGIYLVLQILNSSYYSVYIPRTVVKLLSLFCVGVLFIKERLYGKLSSTMGSALLLLAFLACVCYYVGYPSVGIVLLFMFFSRDISFEKIAYYTIVFSLITLLFVYLSACCGIIDNYISHRVDGRPREYMGFRYVLFPANYMFNVLALYYYLKKRKITWRLIILSVLLDYYIYEKTDARLGCGLTLVLILYSAFYKMCQKRNIVVKMMDIIAAPSFLIMGITSFIVTALYDPYNVVHQRIDYAIGWRLSNAHSSLNIYGIHFLGNKAINWVGFATGVDGTIATTNNESYLYVDNFYMHLIQRYGVLMFLVICILVTAYMMRLYKKRESYMLALLFLIVVHGVIDNAIINLYMNTFWLVLLNQNSLSSTKCSNEKTAVVQQKTSLVAGSNN